MLQVLAYTVHFIRSRFSQTGFGEHSSGIDEVIAPYLLKDDTYKKIRDTLDYEMKLGLSKQTNESAKVKMFVTYVKSLPDGTETGNYLALDLGGTNFRVLLITLKGENVEMKNKIYPISEELMKGEGTKLFDHIASCIASFLSDHQLHNQSLPLGFTFSFPCRQEGLNVGRLVKWTKGFCCAGVEGEDVVRLLHDAIKRHPDVDVECVALLNDTVGCLMSCAFQDHDTRIGVILGTGTNACYVEKLDRVELWDGDNGEPKQVVINTEWGAFGDSGCLDFIRTPADRAIDQQSINPGRQIFEKMISGMYMGELVRLIMVECIDKGLLFNGMLSEEMNTPHRFYTKYVSEIEKVEEGGDFSLTKQILDELGMPDATPEECNYVRKICQAVSERAAFLASAGISCLLNRIELPRVTVAVDGSLFRFHPHFPKLMMDKTKQLLKTNTDVKMVLSEDGSGKGAALVAAVSYRILQARRSTSS